MANWGIAMIGLWIPAIINLSACVKWLFQNVTVVLSSCRWSSWVCRLVFCREGQLGPFHRLRAVFTTACGIAAGWHSSRSLVLKRRHHG